MSVDCVVAPCKCTLLPDVKVAVPLSHALLVAFYDRQGLPRHYSTPVTERVTQVREENPALPCISNTKSYGSCFLRCFADWGGAMGIYTYIYIYMYTYVCTHMRVFFSHPPTTPTGRPDAHAAGDLHPAGAPAPSVP